MDFLTFCPTLVDILKFVEPNDILTCKLLSRSFYDVIKRNHFYLPRNEMCMTITTGKQAPNDFASLFDHIFGTGTTDRWPADHFVQIHVDGKKRSTVALVTNQYSQLAHCPWITSLYYKMNGILSGRNPGNANWDNLVAACANPDEVEDENKNFEARFRETLATLFFRFDFERIEFTANYHMPVEWMHWLAEVFCESLSSCRLLQVKDISPQMEQIVRAIGCKTLDVMSISTNANFTNHIEDILGWNIAPLIIPIRLQSFNSAMDISALLEKWDTGEISFNDVQLDCRETINQDFVWTDQTVDLILSRLRNSAIESVELSEDDKRKICVKRACDKRVLCIETSYNEPQQGNTRCRIVFIKELAPM